MVSWDEFRAKRPKFAKIRLDVVVALASSIRDGVPCNVSEEFWHGTDNVAFKVTFGDGVEWICRVHGEAENVSTAYTTARLDSTVATMRYIGSNSSIPVPTIHAYASQNTIPGLGSGYLLMDFIQGTEVDSSPDGLSNEDEIQVYDQLALVAWKLSRLRFPQIGPIYQNSSGDFHVGPFVNEQGKSFGPFDTSVEFFKFKVDGIRNRYSEWLLADVRSEGDWERAHSVLSLYEEIASHLSDYDECGFPLAHGDLGTPNVLFVRDSSGKLQISAVLDWDSAHASAWPDFGQYPTLLEIHWPTFETGEYSSFVLDQILRTQRLFREGLRHYEPKFSNDPDPLLSVVLDAPAVRVAEFILMYSDPDDGVDCSLLLKYVRAWKKDWKWDPSESVSMQPPKEPRTDTNRVIEERNILRPPFLPPRTYRVRLPFGGLF